MTEKRQLEGVERTTSEKNLERDKEALEYVQKVAIPKKELAIECAPLEYKQQLNGLNEELKKYKQMEEFLKNSIAIAQDQLENGVDKKTSVSVDEE